MKKRAGIALSLFSLLVLVFVFFASPLLERVTTRLTKRVIENQLKVPFFTSLPDGLHVFVCGAGSPLPDPKRLGPCLAVMAGRDIFVVDAGSGAARNMARVRLPFQKIKAVLLTHFHSDHIDSLGEIAMQRWVSDFHKDPLDVYGLDGIEAVVDGYNLAYKQDVGYRLDHHGEELLNPLAAGLRARLLPKALSKSLAPIVIYQDKELTITSIKVDHPPIPAVAYRFDYKGRFVVISGDTNKTVAMSILAQDADLLFHDALSKRMVKTIEEVMHHQGNTRLEKILKDIQNYHASPREAAQVAKEANVKQLVLYHIVPQLPSPIQKRQFLYGVKDIFSKASISQDGYFYSLPVGSDKIIKKDLF